MSISVDMTLGTSKDPPLLGELTAGPGTLVCNPHFTPHLPPPLQVRAQAEEAEKERAARDVAYRADTAKESLRLWEQQEAARKVRDWGGGMGKAGRGGK